MVSRQGGQKHFYVFGGPQGGTLASVKAGAKTPSVPDPTHVQGVRYSYVLVDGPGGRQVFVPESDQCLRQAFLSCSGEPGSPEAETLATEIQRRGLAF